MHCLISYNFPRSNMLQIGCKSLGTCMKYDFATSGLLEECRYLGYGAISRATTEVE